MLAAGCVTDTWSRLVSSSDAHTQITQRASGDFGRLSWHRKSAGQSDHTSVIQFVINNFIM